MSEKLGMIGVGKMGLALSRTMIEDGYEVIGYDIDPGALRMMEQRYRRVGEDDEALAKIAAYYGAPLEKLQWHRERYRKAFSAYLEEAMESEAAVSLELRTGETMQGRVRWWDLGAFGLESEGDGLFTVVQRHAVVDWEGSANGDSTNNGQ